MFIPEFKTKTVPVYEMESYLNDSSEEAKSLKKILTAVKEFKLFLRVEELAFLLDYKEKAELEVYSILVTLGKVYRTDYDYYSLKRDFESIEEFKTFKPNSVEEVKYYAVKQLIEELDIIESILIEAESLISIPESVVVANIHDLQKNLKEWFSGVDY